MFGGGRRNQEELGGVRRRCLEEGDGIKRSWEELGGVWKWEDQGF